MKKAFMKAIGLAIAISALKTSAIQASTLATGRSAPHPDRIMVEYYGASSVVGVNGAMPSKIARPNSVQQFALRTKQPVEGHGVNGTSAMDLLYGTGGHRPAWKQRMLASRASHVIIVAGINDWRYDIPTFKKALAQLVLTAQGAGKQVVLQTTQPTAQRLSGGSDESDREVANRAGAVRELGAEIGVPVIDVHTYLTNYAMEHGKQIAEMMPDGLHPAPWVYLLIGDYAAEQFAALVPK
ncbi:Lysophospholipase L1 [Noviherbaspirillum humi]|uniref:Lysophospholipase L1 n=1 Tax=Noviherbaspirillum humi TaxID=1688639 RepID=A0A239I7L8_9BURK|nr:SGNH/GDSL hydrolase family protein [Noviherbaspirillum humi]SNS89547.1 Lysophospholipase L1 [Noviherbaspirillum humi]